MPKPQYGYLLFDLPADHEVESALATECKVIETLLHNMEMKARVKRVCVASANRFKKYPTYRYRVQFVHLACHGSKSGIAMLGTRMKWDDVGKQITRHLRPLNDGEQRVMVFSCCYSKDGYLATKSRFSRYFSGAYYFKLKRIHFASAMTIWSMFYFKKTLSSPHEKIAKTINDFMGGTTLLFKSYQQGKP